MWGLTARFSNVAIKVQQEFRLVAGNPGDAMWQGWHRYPIKFYGQERWRPTQQSETYLNRYGCFPQWQCRFVDDLWPKLRYHLPLALNQGKFCLERFLTSLCLNSNVTRTKTSMPSFIQDCSSVSSFRTNAWYTTRASKNSQAAGRYFLRSIRRHKCSGASRSIFRCAERTWRVYKCLSNCIISLTSFMLST